MLEVQTKPPTYSWNDINSGIGTQVVTISTPTSPVGTSGAAKVTRAIFHSIVVNNPGSAWEVDLYDGTSSSATSIGKIRSMADPTIMLYDITLNVGLFIDTVKGTTVGDLTVLYLAE